MLASSTNDPHLASHSGFLHAGPAVHIQIGDWWFFSPSCGVGLWYIKAHWGLALAASLVVWFDAVASSLGDPPGRVSYPAAPPSLPPSLLHDHVGQKPRALGHTESLLTRSGLLSSCSEGPVFHLVLDSPLSSPALKGVSVWPRRFLLSVPISSDSEVMPLKDGLGSQFKYPPLIYSFQTAFSFLSSGLHEVCSFFGHFLHLLCHTQRFSLLVGAIKSTTKGFNELPHNSRKCADNCL